MPIKRLWHAILRKPKQENDTKRVKRVEVKKDIVRKTLVTTHAKREMPRMHATLASSQAMLNEALQKAYQGLKHDVADLEKAIASQHTDVSLKGRIEARQKVLLQAIRRIDVSLMSTQDIQREYAHIVRQDTRDEARLEMLASELRIRGAMKTELRKEVGSWKLEVGMGISDSESLPSAPSPTSNFQLPTSSAIRSVRMVPVASAKHLEPEPANIVRTIRETAREVAREEAHHSPQMEDMMEQIAYIKHLNGILRRIDRKQGVRRERIGFLDVVRVV